MRQRFIRNYKLIIKLKGKEVVINPPVRINFTCTKSIAGALNAMSIKIYNINESNRLALVKDAEEGSYIPVSLFIGYDERYKLAYKGSVFKGNNARAGVDIITTLDCLDGGFDYINSFTSATVKGVNEAVGQILRDLKTTTKGKITSQQEIIRPRVLVGNTVKLLNDIVGEDENWYIEDEQLYILKKDEVTSNFRPLIKSSTGLIETPSREAKKVSFKILIDPAVKIGRIIQLESIVQPHLNGIYKIETIDLKGDTYGSEWSQTCYGFLTNLKYSVI